MASKLAKTAEAMLTIRNHIRAAMENSACYQRIGFTDLGFPREPDAQSKALQAAVDELQHAVSLIKSTRWPKDETKL